jgi:hypothetical protein
LSLPDAPSFAEHFPRDPALDALVQAFARGDFRRVRKEGPHLARNGASTEVRAAALTLVERTRPDPLASVFFGLAALLLAFLSAYWRWRAGGR